MKPKKPKKNRPTQTDDKRRLIDDLLLDMEERCSRWRYWSMQRRRLLAYTCIISFAMANIIFASRKTCYSTLTCNNILDLAEIKTSIEIISENV